MSKGILNFCLPRCSELFAENKHLCYFVAFFRRKLYGIFDVDSHDLLSGFYCSRTSLIHWTAHHSYFHRKERKSTKMGKFTTDLIGTFAHLAEISLRTNTLNNGKVLDVIANWLANYDWSRMFRLPTGKSFENLKRECFTDGGKSFEVQNFV